MTVQIDLNYLQTLCCLLIKLPHSNIIHQGYLVLIVKPVCLRADQTIFVQCVYHSVTCYNMEQVYLFLNNSETVLLCVCHSAVQEREVHEEMRSGPKKDSYSALFI